MHFISNIENVIKNDKFYFSTQVYKKKRKGGNCNLFFLTFDLTL